MTGQFVVTVQLEIFKSEKFFHDILKIMFSKMSVRNLISKIVKSSKIFGYTICALSQNLRS